jgi:MoxR-like ATPase
VRIQFTQDLLPADLTGTEIYNAKIASFETRRGPIFANIVLADEINRAPTKVQAARLEAMEERRLRLRRRPVDLVDQRDLRVDRPGAPLEVP